MALYTIVMAALLAAVQTSPAQERTEEYRKLLARCSTDVDTTIRRIETSLTGKLEASNTAFRDLKNLSAASSQAVRDLDRAATDLADRKIDLTGFFNASHAALESGSRTAFDVAITEAYWQLRINGGDYHQAVGNLWSEFEAKRSEAERAHRYGTPKYNEAVGPLRKEYTERDQVNLNRSAARFAEMTRRLADRRRVLAGDLWRIVDFHEARGNASEAARVFKLLREIHQCTQPREPGDSFNSTLDYHLNRERANFVARFLSKFNPDLVLTMDDVFRAEPLGSLRPVVTALPPVGATGTRAEQLARMLSVRLVRLCELQEEQEKILGRLRTLNGSADATPLEVARLRAAGDRFRELYAARAGAVDRRNLAERELLVAKDALNQARLDHELAKVRIYFDNQGNLVEANAPKSRNYESALALQEKILRERREALNDESTPPERRQALRDELIPGIEERKRRMIDNFERARAPLAGAVKSAEERVAKAQKAKDAAVPPTFAMVSEAWEAVKGELDAVRASVPEATRRSIPLLPLDVDEKCEPAMNALLKTLLERGAEADARRRQNDEDLRKQFTALRRVDSELVLIGRSVAALRASAVIESENLLASIGAKPTDEIFQVLGRAKTELEAAKSMLEPGDGRLDKLEQIRERLLGDERGKKLIEAAKDHLAVVVGTLERIGGAAGQLETLIQVRNDLQSPRTALKGIATILSTMAETAETIPVAGSTIAQFLNYYAWAAELIGNKAVEIQDFLIERDLRVLYDNPKPERHLYTMDEIGGAAGENARTRVAATLHTRRLVALARATTLSEAMDMKR
jgi:hypothetical protein